jgi:hypothetical protein
VTISTRGDHEAVPASVANRNVGLVDLLDRVLAGGVVISGDLVLSIADVDLVRISLRALLSSISILQPAPETLELLEPPESPETPGTPET